MTFATQVSSFYRSLRFTGKLPAGVGMLNPYRQEEVIKYCEQFLELYFNDSRPRKLILGINPGRLGGGLTGISFTDPLQLEQACGIANQLPKKAELSSTFIYKMITEFGGPTEFYKKFFISAVCPLGFVQNAKNLNYYDLPALQKMMEQFILKSLREHVHFGVDTTVCFCLGEGKNFDYLNQLNEKHHFFGQIKPLPHPRFVMQYKRKQVNEYVSQYIQQLNQ